MTQARQIPTALSIVSYLFLISGIASVVDMIVRLTRGELYLTLGILGVWIFFGLRRFSPGWRICALVFIWFGLILGPLVAIIALLHDGPADLKVFGERVAYVSPIWLAAAAALFFLLALWQYRVLTRPDIHRLFHAETTTAD